jgi:sugar phosphate isomerase/epimerase
MMTTEMQFGWCGSAADAAQIKQAGLDYVELQLVPMRLEDDVSFAQAKAGIKSLPLPAPVMSYLFPHDLRLVGPEVHEQRARAYFERVLELLRLAGSRTVVLGSGWTRNVPDGFLRQRAEDQYLRALTWLAVALKGSGITLVIEPLNRKESNLINSVAESVRFARMLNCSEVRAHADFYHMDEESEDLSTLVENASWLGHVHLADSGRMNPGTGAYPYAAFFRTLKTAGYRGLMSAECGRQGEAVTAMKFSADFLRRQWHDA